MALAVVLAGGGTGGHVFPALALAEAIRQSDPDTRLHFIGSETGLERTRVPSAGFPLSFVASRPVLGRGPAAAARALLTTARGILEAGRLLRGLRADLVIGVGGWASVPTVAAALLARVPTALIEPNARPGRANRLLGHLAAAVYVQFDAAREGFPAERTHRLGLPVRPGRATARVERPHDRFLRLLVVGGSQGARSINRAVTASLGELEGGSQLDITHQTGPADFETVRAAYERRDLKARVAPFFDDMPERMACADLVLARAGAATIAELCCAGRASILVPYPHAADDHQTANARELEQAGASVVIRDAELAQQLVPELRALLHDPERRGRMAAAAARRGQPNAAHEIWQHCKARVVGARR
ncbi:MAG: undecaprenyldiphospho-muramoylpentapeptide beta-N-acetylglucosaminyltransferase [Myxococcota bacterium]